jgi:hypothetical protein
MTKKNQMTVTDYYTKMSNFADDLAAFGAPLRDDEFVVYLLASLDEEYNPVFMVIVAQTDPISPSELYAQLLSFEQHTTLRMVSAPGGLPSAFTVPVVTNTPTDVALAPLIMALAAAGVMACLHMVDSRAVALTMPPMHPGRNARFA